MKLFQSANTSPTRSPLAPPAECPRVADMPQSDHTLTPVCQTASNNTDHLAEGKRANIIWSQRLCWDANDRPSEIGKLNRLHWRDTKIDLHVSFSRNKNSAEALQPTSVIKDT